LKQTKEEKVLWVIFLYAIFSFINNNLLLYVFNNDDFGGYLVLSIFTGIEFICFVTVLIFLLANKTALNVIKVIALAFILFCVISIIGSNHESHFDSIQSSISSILIIIFCIFYFFEKLNEPEMKFIYSDFHFWIILAFLIYLAATLFLYGYVTSLPQDIAKKYWVINSISNIIKNILFCIAIIKFLKPPNIPTKLTYSEY